MEPLPTLMPSFSSSPRMRSVPHNRFSSESPRIRSRTSCGGRGRPVGLRERHHQQRRLPCRCQRRTVSGCTNTRWRRHSVANGRTSIQKSIFRDCSRSRRLGRRATANCCRSRRSSRRRSGRQQNAGRTAPSPDLSSSILPRACPIGAASGRATFCRPTAWLLVPARLGNEEPGTIAMRDRAL
jgi:hypothetical protein